MSKMDHIIPIRIAVTGSTGRMGIEVIKCLIQYQKQRKADSRVILTVAIVKSQPHDHGNMDLQLLIQSSSTEVIITDNLVSVKDNFDILIDFTHPEVTIKYLEFCVLNSKNMIIGTTGFNQNHYKLMNLASQKIGIVYSANFSIGIAIMLKVLKEIARTIGNIVDIDIVESHHSYKKDMPSGTALAIHNLIKANIPSKNKMSHESIYYNDILQELYLSSVSNHNNIQIFSIRSGDIIGEHTVLFSGIGERLEIKHVAFNRKIFANGAVYAAIWLGSIKTGLFNLNDVLEKT